MKRLIFVFLLFLTATSSQAFASPPPPEPLFERLDLPTIKPEGAEDILSQVVEGQTPGGAYFKIVLPADWNGDLVIWNHGYSLDEPNADVDLGTLEDVQLAQGYAVAASSYRQSGWALFHTVEDLGELYQEFTARFGAPGQVYVYGASLGGIVTAQAIEQAKLGNVVGAMSMCGATAGSRVWDGALDLRLIYDVVASGIPGAAIPGGAEGLPEDSDFNEIDFVFAVNAATGILLSPEFRTPQQQANLDKILEVTGIPQTFLLADMHFATFGLSDLVHDSMKLGGAIGVGNDGVIYGDIEIDRDVQRVTSDPVANQYLGWHYTPSGIVGEAKIVQIHTDKDGLVIVENAGEYADIIPAANLSTAIVVEDESTHCGFTAAETVAAWESLRAWVAGDQQPDAIEIQRRCESALSEYDGPCRFEPGFEISDIDTRIRPRTRWQVLFRDEMFTLSGKPPY